MTLLRSCQCWLNTRAGATWHGVGEGDGCVLRGSGAQCAGKDRRVRAGVLGAESCPEEWGRGEQGLGVCWGPGGRQNVHEKEQSQECSGSREGVRVKAQGMVCLRDCCSVQPRNASWVSLC